MKQLMERERIRRVIIVGAGIGGPVLAMWLRKIGLEVVLVDARKGAAIFEGAFLGVAPNGMSVLEGLGIAKIVAAHGYPCDAFQFSNARGKAIGSIDRSEDASRFGWPLTMIRRGRLHAILAEEAKRRGVDLRFAKELSAIDRSDPTKVVARFSDGTEISGDILVGSDGLRSTVRSLVFPEAKSPSFSGLFDYGGFVSLPSARLPFAPGINVMVFGRRAFFGAFLTTEGETWWFHNGPPPALEGGETDARERLLELHRDDPPWVRELIQATPDILGPWPINELRGMSRWSDGRICLIGDAAHAMPPSAGQGASLAMEDAMVLARCLRDIDDPARAFREFEAIRRPRVDAIFEYARRSNNGKAVSHPISEWFRDMMLPVFLRFGGSAQSKAYAFRIDWGPSASLESSRGSGRGASVASSGAAGPGTVDNEAG